MLDEEEDIFVILDMIRFCGLILARLRVAKNTWNLS